MKIVTDKIELSKHDNFILIPFTNRQYVLNELSKLNGKLTVDIKKHREKRSHTANSYMWVLLDKLAKALKSNKELIYKELVLRVGVFDTIAITKKATEIFMKNWSGKGLGWFCINLGESHKVDGTNVLQCYYGSSTYDTKQMATLIDEIVTECKEADIETMSDNELNKLKEEWR